MTGTITGPTSTTTCDTTGDTTGETTGTATGSATGETTGTNGDRSDRPAVPRSIARLLDVLEAVVVRGTCNLTAVAEACELTPTTALRYLRALEARRYLDRDATGAFSAGPTLLRLSESLRGGTVLDRLATVAQPRLDALAHTTSESTYLAVGDAHTATYIATAESPRAIRHVGWVGQDVALDGSALGAALAEPGVTATRTGAVEPDITAMSRALPSRGRLGIAVSIVGPEHRFTPPARADHERALAATVDALDRDLRTSGEDFTT